VNDRVFDELVRKHEVALMTFARSLTRDSWSADEAVQETLVRAWKYLDTFDRRGSFEGWLLRICRNVVIDLANAAARRPTSIENHELERMAPEVENDATHELIELLHQLTVDHREVLVIVGVLGLSYEEAAHTLDIPIGTVRSRLGRARQAFSQLLVEAQSASCRTDVA
jgi:RNA polymerase sigma-70 factor (ECF subfamily)